MPWGPLVRLAFHGRAPAARRDPVSPVVGLRLVKVLVLSREYPPNVYGGAGVVVDQLTRALAGRMSVEVRCFGEPEPARPDIAVKGYAAWERVARGADGPRFALALETLSVGLAMARDAVDADV